MAKTFSRSLYRATYTALVVNRAANTADHEDVVLVCNSLSETEPKNVLKRMQKEVNKNIVSAAVVEIKKETYELPIDEFMAYAKLTKTEEV